MSKHLEERVSALEAELAKLKGKEPEVKTGLIIGKWHCDKDRPKFMVFRLSETEFFGIDSDGDWFSDTWPDIWPKELLDNLPFTHHPTEDEVLEAHKEYFKDFKEGVRLKDAYSGEIEIVSKYNDFGIEDGNFYQVGVWITYKGKVAEIIPSKLIVDGHEVTKEGDKFRIGKYTRTKKEICIIQEVMESSELKTVKHGLLTFTLEDITKMLEL